MKKIIYAFLLVGIISACNKQERKESTMIENSMYDAILSIEILDKDNNDLLDSKNKHFYDWSKMRLIEDINKPNRILCESNLDCPYGINFIKANENNQYNIIEIINIKIRNNIPFLIRYNEHEIDTIKCEIKEGKNYVLLKKIWYNGELKHESSSLDNGLHKIRIIR